MTASSGRPTSLEHVLEGLAPKYATTLVHALLQLEDARTRQLNRIEAGVESLLDGPYHTGRLYLEESLSASGEQRRKTALADARRSFVEAHSNYRDRPLEASWSSAHVAVIDYMTADEAANSWSRRAVTEAQTALSVEQSKVGYLQVGRLRVREEGVSEPIGVIFLIVVGIAAMMAVMLLLKFAGFSLDLATLFALVVGFAAPIAMLNTRGVGKGLAKVTGDERSERQRKTVAELQQWVTSLSELTARTGG